MRSSIRVTLLHGSVTLSIVILCHTDRSSIGSHHGLVVAVEKIERASILTTRTRFQGSYSLLLLCHRHQRPSTIRLGTFSLTRLSEKMLTEIAGHLFTDVYEFLDSSARVRRCTPGGATSNSVERYSSRVGAHWKVRQFSHPPSLSSSF